MDPDEPAFLDRPTHTNPIRTTLPHHILLPLLVRSQSFPPLLGDPPGLIKEPFFLFPFQIYVFKNIPFAAPPVGDLRWRAPAPPPPNDTLADGSYGPSCVQTGIGAPLGEAGALLGPQSEDCLYLDVYAPGAAVRGNATNLPVIHWIYGVSS